ncbi:MAG TPA: phosphoribosylanthranilate isomerase [Alphaproteobacteria bacterium]|nr:phosphoribosylanthranilate isomerase [Alphaproteobacteria bacterium]
MSVKVKICGVNSPAAVEAAVGGGAAFVGFVFYPPSPRYLTIAGAAALARAVPSGVTRVGLFVEADDATLGQAIAEVGLELLQLHGGETPARVAAIKERFAIPVMKAIRIARAGDVDAAKRFEGTADWLLFDALPPESMTTALPGGNALSFDWRLIAGRRWEKPWMLSGGLTAKTLAEAVRTSGAAVVDVSSGVEDRPGHKDPARIAAFLAAAKRL